MVEEIWKAYPRKVAKPAGVKAIRKALTKIEGPELLKRTAAFASVSATKDPQYIPHPATWFNQERFNDDAETWKAAPKPDAVPDGFLKSRNAATGEVEWWDKATNSRCDAPV